MSSIFVSIKNSLNKYKSKKFIRKWAKSTDSIGNQFYIKRDFDEAEIFYDIYWYIKASSESPHIDNISRRCSKESAIRIIKHVEKYDLPELLERIKEEQSFAKYSR